MTLSRQERHALTSAVLRRTHELHECAVLMMADPRRDGRGTVDHAPDSVNATEVRVSERWQESWVRKLHDDPDVNPVLDSIDKSEIDPDAADGAARRLAYAQEHNLRRPIEHAPRSIPADESDDRIGRLLAIIGTTQADFD